MKINVVSKFKCLNNRITINMLQFSDTVLRNLKDTKIFALADKGQFVICAQNGDCS